MIRSWCFYKRYVLGAVQWVAPTLPLEKTIVVLYVTLATGDPAEFITSSYVCVLILRAHEWVSR